MRVSGSAGLSFSSEVTNDVAWEDSLMVGLEGALLGWCVARLVRCFSPPGRVAAVNCRGTEGLLRRREGAWRPSGVS